MQDLYVVNWLINNTEKPIENIRWSYEESSNVYVATLRGGSGPINLKIGSVNERTGSRLIIELRTEDVGEAVIEEPYMSVGFRRKYDSKDDKELADALKRLFTIISRLDSDRENELIEDKEERKRFIFKKLLDLF